LLFDYKNQTNFQLVSNSKACFLLFFLLNQNPYELYIANKKDKAFLFYYNFYLIFPYFTILRKSYVQHCIGKSRADVLLSTIVALLNFCTWVGSCATISCLRQYPNRYAKLPCILLNASAKSAASLYCFCFSSSLSASVLWR